MGKYANKPKHAGRAVKRELEREERPSYLLHVGKGRRQKRRAALGARVEIVELPNMVTQRDHLNCPLKDSEGKIVKIQQGARLSLRRRETVPMTTRVLTSPGGRKTVVKCRNY